jgi:hypothetical protein
MQESRQTFPSHSDWGCDVTFANEGATLEEAIGGVLKSFGSADKDLVKKCQAIDMAGYINSLEFDLKQAQKRLACEQKKGQVLRDKIKDILHLQEIDDEDDYDE